VSARRTAEAAGPAGPDAARVFALAPRRGPGLLWGTVTIGGIGIVSALVLSSATPALTPGGLFGSGSGTGVLFGAGVSPMIDLGQDLRRPNAGPALHYTTTAESPPYLTLLTLDRFVGTTWTPGADAPEPGNTVDDIRTPPGLSGQVATTETRTRIVIDGVETNLLPAPAPAKRIVGLDGSWFWNSKTLTIASTNSTTRGQRYTVTALDLQPTAAQLRDSSRNYPAGVRASLRLPAHRPAIIDETARAVTRGANSAYDAAVALQDYLRGSAFRYDTQAPVTDGYDGGGADVIGTFLEVKRGYCVHFASAMAIMARTLGIPARIAMGYLPGTPSSDIPGELGRFNVDSHDLHAWPELYFVGVGWVPFEPTPGRGTVPDYSRPAGAAAPTSAPGASVPTGSPRSADRGNRADTGAVQPAPGRPPAADTLLSLGGILALVLAALLAPAGARSIRRAGRRSRVRSGRGSAADAWAELSDTAIDHAVPVSETETPRVLAGRLSALPALSGLAGAGAAAALGRILVATERHRYDRPGRGVPAEAGPALADDLDRVIRAVHSGAEPVARWRASALPASLWPAVLGRRDGRAARGG
jgi:transglutaminase-like putative cysteine protease